MKRRTEKKLKRTANRQRRREREDYHRTWIKLKECGFKTHYLTLTEAEDARVELYRLNRADPGLQIYQCENCRRGYLLGHGEGYRRSLGRRIESMNREAEDEEESSSHDTASAFAS